MYPATSLAARQIHFLRNHVFWRSIYVPSVHATKCRGTVAGGSALDKAIQIALSNLEDTFKVEYDDNKFKRRLKIVRSLVRDTIMAGYPTREGRLRTESDFESHVKAGSNEERNLVNLLRRMAEGQVPWEDLFLNGTLLSSPLTTSTDYNILSLEAFFHPEPESPHDPSIVLGAQ